jgi:hypothetical protein
MVPPDQSPKPRTVVSKVEARQGVTGHNVRYVLVIGLGAIVIAFAVLYSYISPRGLTSRVPPIFP